MNGKKARLIRKKMLDLYGEPKNKLGEELWKKQ